MFMMLGSVALDVLTVKGLEVRDAWVHAEHSVIKGKPKLQFTGAKLREATLHFRLHRDWGDRDGHCRRA